MKNQTEERPIQQFEFRDWCDISDSRDDLISLLHEFEGKLLVPDKLNIGVRITSVNYESDPLEVNIEAFPFTDPSIKVIETYFPTNGDMLYRCTFYLLEGIIAKFKKTYPDCITY